MKKKELLIITGAGQGIGEFLAKKYEKIKKIYKGLF